MTQVKGTVEAYLDTYWTQLHELGKERSSRQVKEAMLADIKHQLSAFEQLDSYDGYQMIAEIWANSLEHDSEFIEQLGFYQAGRTREPNMVKKGKKKEPVQDGWNGVVVPNSLIASEFYAKELAEIEAFKSRIAEIESEMRELVENAKVEDSDEYNALFDSLKKNEEGEAQDSFEGKSIKDSLKEAEKGSLEYDLLKKVDDLTKEKSAVNKKIKTKEQELKEVVADRILQLTDEEVDQLLYKKWFGSVIEKVEDLVESPLKAEIAVIDELNKRYSETLDILDDEIAKLEKELEAMMKELVVL